MHEIRKSSVTWNWVIGNRPWNSNGLNWNSNTIVYGNGSKEEEFKF